MRPDLSDGTYECAAVLALQPIFASYVLSARAALVGSQDMQQLQEQLDPHITVLFAGLQDAFGLRQLHKIVQPYQDVELAFSVRAAGLFFDTSGRPINVHYMVESTAIAELHATLLESFLSAGFVLQTSYSWPNYTPHISILDRVMIPLNAAADVPLPDRHAKFRAGSCCLVGVRRDPA